MFGTCIYCTRTLGRNEVLEAFPVGRRLAFDAARGRLWAVCPWCGRWNLSPIEERWEAIESCERAYGRTRLRASTGNIGLARVGAGLDLIRIGRPERPELAAWRYGSRFAERYRKHLITMTAMLGLGSALAWTGAMTAFVAAVPGGIMLFHVPTVYTLYRDQRRVLARIDGDAERVVRGRHLPSARIIRPEGDAAWTFAVETDAGMVRLEAEAARDVAGVLLAHYNQNGARRTLIRRALARLESSRSPNVADDLFREAAGAVTTPVERYEARRHGGPTRRLRELLPDQRLALEMVVHEEAERRALEGELNLLAERWQEAERIAAIADDLLLPRRFHEFIERHRP